MRSSRKPGAVPADPTPDPRSAEVTPPESAPKAKAIRVCPGTPGHPCTTPMKGPKTQHCHACATRLNQVKAVAHHQAAFAARQAKAGEGGREGDGPRSAPAELALPVEDWAPSTTQRLAVLVVRNADGTVGVDVQGTESLVRRLFPALFGGE
jgi:hypothetical protein